MSATENPQTIALPTRIGAACASESRANRYAISRALVTRATGAANGHAIATDGRMLALTRADVPEGMRMILPPKACDVAPSKKSGALTILVDGKTAIVGAKPHAMPDQDMTFPPYASVFPAEPTSTDVYARVSFSPELLAELARALTHHDDAKTSQVEICFPIDSDGRPRNRAIIVSARGPRGNAVGLLMPCSTDDKTSGSERAQEMIQTARRIIAGEAHPWEKPAQPSGPRITPNPCAAAVALAEARAAT